MTSSPLSSPTLIDFYVAFIGYIEQAGVDLTEHLFPLSLSLPTPEPHTNLSDSKNDKERSETTGMEDRAPTNRISVEQLLAALQRFEWFTQDEVRMTVIQTLEVVRVLAIIGDLGWCACPTVVAVGRLTGILSD
jgi:hypothetical protein